MRTLITGGAGFIGLNLVQTLIKEEPKELIVCIDNLTYASNESEIRSINSPNFEFIKLDICDQKKVFDLFSEFNFNCVIHLAAESHVDNSILDPLRFAQTNVLGTLNLLEACRKFWINDDKNIFYHISTDEVFGSIEDGSFSHNSCYNPRSPYSASKASSDHFVKSYFFTYGLATIISNCSNNYGPYQNDEKFIPTIIRSIVRNKSIPVYGKGHNVRDWLHVLDHVKAINLIRKNGSIGNVYTIGGDNEISNLELVKTLIQIVDEKLGNPEGHSNELISFIKDRQGHDLRYSIDHSKLSNEMQWSPLIEFRLGLESTVDFYINKYA